MENNFSLASATLQGWVNKQAVLYKLSIKPFQKFDFEYLKIAYNEVVLTRFPTVEQFFLEDADGVFWELKNKQEGIWLDNQEDSWYEENGIFIGQLGYAEIKLYGTGPIVQKVTNLIG